MREGRGGRRKGEEDKFAYLLALDPPLVVDRAHFFSTACLASRNSAVVYPPDRVEEEAAGFEEGFESDPSPTS